MSAPNPAPTNAPTPEQLAAARRIFRERDEARRELERTLREIEESRAEARRLRLSLAVGRLARTMGYLSPDVTHRLIEPADVEFDESGEPDPASVRHALKALAEECPELVGRPNPRAEARRRARAGHPTPPGMSPAESAAIDRTVDRMLRSGQYSWL